MHDSWDPKQYDKFRAERSKPFFDLLAMVQPRENMHIVDLGCGTGELTRAMHEKLRAKETLGIDSSEKMLASSRGLQSAGLRFEKCEIESFNPTEKFDLIFSNAAIQWTADHANLLARLSGFLSAKGQAAVQMPANDDHVTHESARVVAWREPFKSALKNWERNRAVLAPERYASILHTLGFAQQDVILRVYPHVLESRETVIDWVRGTLLTDYQKRLPAEMWARFLDEYREELFAALPDERPFFYPFKRILIWAMK